MQKRINTSPLAIQPKKNEDDERLIISGWITPTFVRGFRVFSVKKRTKPNDRKKCENAAIRKFLRKNFMINATSQDVLCNKCRHHFYSNKQKKQTQINETQQNETTSCISTGMSSPPSISLPIQRTPLSHAYCFVCKRPGPKLVLPSSAARLAAFIQKEVIIPKGSRCCPSHLDDDNFKTGVLDNIPTIDSSLVNRTTILELIKKIREYGLQNSTSTLNFDSPNLSSKDCAILTGITKENFEHLHDSIVSEIKNTPCRSSRMSLGIFLLKLRSGMSNQLLSTIFGISKSSLRRAIKSVRLALMTNFVPINLGLQHISREDVINSHTRPLAQSLFGNLHQVIAVLDGTYIFIQKSNNFAFQRRSYSVHKGRPLVKPMVIVATDGYFLSVVGPYLADSRNNDASILNHMFKTNIEDIRNWFHEEDIFIVDRGFRNSIDMLEEFGIHAEMPRLLGRGEKQLPTSDANASRLVTKVRWVVEAANARIKHWKYLAHVLPTNQVPFIGDYVRIVCAISNRFLKPLSVGDADADEALAAKMTYLSGQINLLQSYVEEHAFDKRSLIWEAASPEALNFPKLNEADIRNLTCGVYQMKLASCYIQEYMEGDADILIHREHPGLIRVRLQSRHVSSKRYLLWIKYSESAVTAWYCRCRTGARVVGVCSHIAAVIWFLGYAQHNEEGVSGVQNWSEFVTDAALIDSSDSDDSDENGKEE